MVLFLKKDDFCNGFVWVEGISFMGIFGFGIIVLVGKVIVNRLGVSFWFFSVGVGVGLDVGFVGFVIWYNSFFLFKGCVESYNGFVLLFGCLVGYSWFYDVDGNYIGDMFNGLGFFGLFGICVGFSGIVIDIFLVGG